MIEGHEMEEEGEAIIIITIGNGDIEVRSNEREMLLVYYVAWDWAK
jgi:hypothetical protein